MTRTPARWLAGGLLVLTVAALGVSAAYGVVMGDFMDAFAFAPLLLAFTGVGAFVASRQANPVGWLFLAEGLGFALDVATSTYARYVTRAGVTSPSAAWAAWLGAIPGELGFLFVLALLLFPDGRLPSRRWRVVAWLIVAAEALLLIVAATSSAGLRSENSAVLVSPVRLIPDSLADPVVNVVHIAFLPLCLAAAVGCAARYRRSPADEREQIKWVAYAGLLTAVALLICGMFNNPLGGLLAVGPLIPVAAGIAIFKYRLYDIDVVIRKTIVYGGLAAFITVVYIVIVAGIGSLGSGFLQAGARPNLGLSILATAVVAVAFQPVRERVQRLADRLVFGRRLSGYELISQLGARLEASPGPEDVAGTVAFSVQAGLDARWVRVSLGRHSERPVAGAGIDPSAPDGPVLHVPLVHGPDVLGALDCGPKTEGRYSDKDAEFLATLGRQAALAIRNSQLTTELSRRFDELAESRARLVHAEAAGRRQLERDIHDGVQQELVAVLARLGLARNQLRRDKELAETTLKNVLTDGQRALESLQELVRGIHPPVLTDRGLLEAVRERAARLPIAAEVRSDGLPPDARFGPDTEAAAYFFICEALGNVLKHARAARAMVRLRADNGRLAVEVRDDGRGFTTQDTTQSGLRGLRDRIEALGGQMDIASTAGQGTTVSAWLPTGEAAHG